MSDDIFMQHNALTTSTDDLRQGQRRMADNLRDFIDQIAPHLNNSQGALKDAWESVNKTVNDTVNRANDAMNSAVVTLEKIHEEHVRADGAGANQMTA